MNTIIEVDDLIITGEHSTYFTPNVHFSASTGQCSILGESYLEDAFDFYDTLIDWFKKYYASGRDNVVLDFKLSYFNTSSSRAIVDLIRVLKGFWDEGKNITINWHYPNPDYDDLKIEGEDFAEETGFPVSFVEYTKK